MIQAKFQQGLALHQQGMLAEAERIYEAVLQVQPKHFDALHLLGIVALQTRRTQRGVDLIKNAIRLNANDPTKYNDLGMGQIELKRFNDALASFDKAIALRPDFAAAHFNRGNALKNMKRLQEALASYTKAIALNQRFVAAYNNRGNTLQEVKRFDEALADYDKAIALKSDNAVTHNNRGNAFKELKRFEDALASYDKAIALQPDYAEAFNQRGVVLRELERTEEALASFNKAIALQPNDPGLHVNRGAALQQLKQLRDALASYDKALALKPDYAEAHYGRGSVLSDSKRYDAALASFGKALALRSDYAEAWLGRGNILSELNEYGEAFSAYDRALALKPDSAHAWLGRGNIFRELKRYDEAFSAYDKVLAVNPDLAEAWFGRANILNELKRYEETVAAYDKALALKPGLAEAEGRRLRNKMLLCDWSNFDAEYAHLNSSIRNGLLAAPPFSMLAISASADVQLQCAKLFSQTYYPTSNEQLWQGERYEHDRIRVAYLSADFCDHPVAYLLAGVLEQHDQKRFETIAVSFGADDSSEMLARLKRAFGQFIDVKARGDADVAKLLKTLEIDVAVDLMGYTANSRPAILAQRPVPIQVNYLGYPGTMGADFIDYVIADTTLIPASYRPHYSEKIVYLPNSYQANDSKRSIADKLFTRAEMGLPQDCFVYCCFNNNYKITADVFDCWMTILKSVESSVLWLLGDASVASNLRKEAEARGVNSARLVFAKQMSLPDHLARHLLADLFLDTFPYNAHTTASDALWAGLPVLTRIGETFASRVAASLLNAIDLPELITSTLQAYQGLAIELANNRDKLTAIKNKLANNRLTKPLFDTPLFARHLEGAYTAMHERHLAGLPPDHIGMPR